jgi:hypothetical protein
MRARIAFLASLVVLFLTSSAFAQSTTGTLRGTVKSADDNATLAEAEVTLVHEPTGTEKSTVTNTSGEFVFTGLRVGGPYHVTANFTGFKASVAKDIFLSANKVVDIDLPMRLQEEVIEVESNAVPRNTSGRQVIGKDEIEALPSIDRDPRDMVRRTPEVTVSGSSHVMSVGGMNPRFNSITIDGLRMDDDFGLNSSGYPTNRSPIPLSAIEELVVEQAPFDVRYDKFIGGNVNIITKSGTNEVHGELFFSYSDDHLLGHHSGPDDPTSPSHLTLNSGAFHEYRYGAEIAGPIIKDKMHFMVAFDGLSTNTPTSVGPAGSGAAITVNQVTQADVMMAQQIAQQIYKFNAGDPSASLAEGNVSSIGKIEYEIDKYNRVVATYIGNFGNQIQKASANTFTGVLPLTSQWYNANGTLNSGSVRWFSDVSDELSTEVSIAGKQVSSRVPPLNGNGFMAASIFVCNPAPAPGMPCPAGHSGTILLGPDDFRHTNELDNDLIQLRAAANYLAGKHLVTAGLEYELLHIRNLFIPDSNGAFQYGNTARGQTYIDGLMQFQNQTPFQLTTYQTSTACTGANPSPDCLDKAAANFNTGTLAPFIQDQLKITPTLTLTAGFRFELYKADQNIVSNSTFTQRYADQNNLVNTNTLDGRFLVMPRLGVSYLATPQLNLRAGGGLYSGGTPTVWMSNAYTNDGVRIGLVTLDQNALDLNGFDGRNIPAAIKNQVLPGNGNVDALDPKFKLPSAWKVGTGADWELPGKAFLKLNYVYTQVQDGVFWVDLRRCNSNGIADATGLGRASTQAICSAIPANAYPITAKLGPVGQLPDGRYYYDTANFPTNVGYDMMLSNNDGYGRHVGGYGNTLSVLINKAFPWGLFLAGSYGYQHVMEVNPANSSISSSNYKNVAVFDPNYADLARSAYETTHRFTATIEFSHKIIGHFVDSGPWKHMKTAFGLFAETRSGQPYSWTFGDSAGGTNLSQLFGEDRTIARVDRMLFYVPKCGGQAGVGNDVTLQGISQTDFNNFLHDTGLDKYCGQVAPRNGFTGPWISRVDVRLAQDLPNPLGPRHRAKFLIDIQNVGNMLDHKWGRVSGVGFPYVAPAVDVAYDPTMNKYVYSNLRSSNQNTVDLFSSVWKMSLGLVYDF